MEIELVDYQTNFVFLLRTYQQRKIKCWDRKDAMLQLRFVSSHSFMQQMVGLLKYSHQRAVDVVSDHRGTRGGYCYLVEEKFEGNPPDAQHDCTGSCREHRYSNTRAVTTGTRRKTSSLSTIDRGHPAEVRWNRNQSRGLFSWTLLRKQLIGKRLHSSVWK